MGIPAVKFQAVDHPGTFNTFGHRGQAMAGEHLTGAQPSEAVPDLSVAIPFYNEEQNVVPVLEDLIQSLENAGITFELIAVDNGSIDGTGEKIDSMLAKDPRIVPVRIPKNRGYGFGILSGLAETRGRVVGYAWGDGQVSGQDLVRIYQALESDKAHMAKARRVKRHDGLFRLVQTKVYFGVFTALFGRACPDPNGCPKLFLRPALEKIAPRSHDWLLDPEIMIKAGRLDLKIGQVPVEFQRRKRGSSKVNLWTALGFIVGLLGMRIFGFQKR